MRSHHKWDALILSLLRSPSLKAAAAKAGISYATAKRYAADKTFQDRLAEAKRSAFGQALAVLQGNSARAATTLAKNLASDKLSDRTQAAKILLDFAFQGHTAIDLAAKLAEVESLMKGKDHESERPEQEGGGAAGKRPRPRR